MIPLPGSVQLIAAGVVVLAVGGYVLHCEHVKTDRAAFIAKLQAQAEAQEAKTRQIIEQQKRSADEAEKRSQRTIADIRSKYDRMRQQGTSSGKLSPVPDTAPVANAEARDSRLLEVLRIAEEQASQLEQLQGWIAEQAR